jgi:hypothetical protein
MTTVQYKNLLSFYKGKVDGKLIEKKVSDILLEKYKIFD